MGWSLIGWYCLGQCIDDVWPREVVIGNGVGVAKVTFQPPADIAHPGHVHVTAQDGEMKELGGS